MQGVVPTSVSTASGYYQITNTTWAGIPTSITGGYPTAMSAPADVQANAAAYLYNQSGFASWAPYNSNLAAAISSQGGASAFPTPGNYAAPSGLPGEADWTQAAVLAGTNTSPNQTAPVSGTTQFDSAGNPILPPDQQPFMDPQFPTTPGQFSPATLAGTGGLGDFFQNLINDIGGLFTRLFLVILGIVALGVALWAFASKDVKAAAVNVATRVPIE